MHSHFTQNQYTQEVWAKGQGEGKRGKPTSVVVRDAFRGVRLPTMSTPARADGSLRATPSSVTAAAACPVTSAL